MSTSYALQNQPLKLYGALLIALLLPQLAGGLGAFFTAQSVSGWYMDINKPWFTPPGYVFPIVWPALYLMMGTASWLVWRSEGAEVPKKKALSIYGLHLLLNTAWSFLFFGLESPAAGMAGIIPLLGMIIWTAWLFSSFSRPAALLMLPYLLWVSFASVLNASILALN